jgi:hypothetical protein
MAAYSVHGLSLGSKIKISDVPRCLDISIIYYIVGSWDILFSPREVKVVVCLTGSQFCFASMSSVYESLRLKNIEDNKRVLAELGILNPVRCITCLPVLFIPWVSSLAYNPVLLPGLRCKLSVVESKLAQYWVVVK